MTGNHVKRWSQDKLVLRTREIMQALKGQVSNRTELIDELIVVLLDILRRIVDEKQWTGIRPIDLFEPVFGICDTEIHARFVETKYWILEYEASDADRKMLIRPKLVARGIL